MAEAQQRAFEFTASLDRYAERLPERLNQAYIHIILKLFENVVVGGDFSPGTPRDLGFAANSWVVGLNGIAPFRQPSDVPEAVRKGREPIAIVSVDEGQTKILGVKLTDEVHLTSNTVYMGALEDGHSGQAPTGFIWLAIHAGPQIVDQVCREMLG